MVKTAFFSLAVVGVERVWVYNAKYLYSKNEELYRSKEVVWKWWILLRKRLGRGKNA